MNSKLVNDVLSELRSSAGYNEDRAKDQSFKPFFEIKLNGAALSDKKLSLMEIVRQLVIEATAEEYPKVRVIAPLQPWRTHA